MNEEDDFENGNSVCDHDQRFCAVRLTIEQAPPRRKMSRKRAMPWM